MTLFINRKVNVPEVDILDTVAILARWFKNHPDREVCRATIFGHQIWEVGKDTIESDVRAAAAIAKPYEKTTT